LLYIQKKAALEFGRRAKENVRNDDDDEDDKPKKKVNDNSLERQIHEKMAFIRKQSSAKEFRAYNVSANRLPKLYDK
jgi:hypothetical protein